MCFVNLVSFFSFLVLCALKCVVLLESFAMSILRRLRFPFLAISHTCGFQGALL